MHPANLVSVKDALNLYVEHVQAKLICDGGDNFLTLNEQAMIEQCWRRGERHDTCAARVLMNRQVGI